VHYRSISRPLVELIARYNLPASVDVLRPPTFARLREHLHEQPGYYHILQFDGHGSYSATAGVPGPFTLQGPLGKLVFETEDPARPGRRRPAQRLGKSVAPAHKPIPSVSAQVRMLLRRRRCSTKPGVALAHSGKAIRSQVFYDGHEPVSRSALARLRAWCCNAYGVRTGTLWRRKYSEGGFYEERIETLESDESRLRCATAFAVKGAGGFVRTNIKVDVGRAYP